MLMAIGLRRGLNDYDCVYFPQARWWEEFTGEERPGIYRAHWLIFTADDDVITRIEQDMFNLDNLAIVHIKQDTLGLSVDKRFEVTHNHIAPVFVVTFVVSIFVRCLD